MFCPLPLESTRALADVFGFVGTPGLVIGQWSRAVRCLPRQWRASLQLSEKLRSAFAWCQLLILPFSKLCVVTQHDPVHSLGNVA